MDISDKVVRLKNLRKIWSIISIKDLDADIFDKMSNVYGKCEFCGCYGQYKGWFNNQLGKIDYIN